MSFSDWLDIADKNELIEHIRNYLRPQYARAENFRMIDELIKDQLEVLEDKPLKLLVLFLEEEHGHIVEEWK